MQITIHWFGQLRDAAGIAEERVDVEDGATILNALGVAASGRERLERFLFDDGRIASTIIVSANGTQVTEPATVQAAENATLVVMSPISGG